MYAVVDPATGETVKEYPTITDDELRDAVARADRAHREWSKAATVADRASLVRRVGELYSERRKELAEIIVAEMGKPVGQARGEVDFCASIYEFYADNAEALMADEPIELLEGEGSAVVRRSSLGVAAWDHAVELPLLPGRTLRGAEPDHRQYGPVEARAPVPAVGRGDGADVPSTPASPTAPT